MPALDPSLPQAQATSMPLVVKPSLVCELVWAMALTPRESEEPYPARVDRFAGHRDLEERLKRFWDDGQGFFTEVLVLADRAGALFEEDP